jgi:hypothetical protein
MQQIQCKFLFLLFFTCTCTHTKARACAHTHTISVFIWFHQQGISRSIQRTAVELDGIDKLQKTAKHNHNATIQDHMGKLSSGVHQKQSNKRGKYMLHRLSALVSDSFEKYRC